MEQKTLTYLVRENQDRAVKGRFTSSGPDILGGGWYDIQVQTDNQRYNDRVYSYTGDVIVPLSLLTGRLAFRAINHEVENAPLPVIHGHGHPPYSKEEFFEVNGCNREDVALITAVVDEVRRGSSREFQGDIIVYPCLTQFKENTRLDEEIAEIEKNVFGISTREAIGLHLMNSEKFKSMQKMGHNEIMERYR